MTVPMVAVGGECCGVCAVGKVARPSQATLNLLPGQHTQYKVETLQQYNDGEKHKNLQGPMHQRKH